MCERAPPLIPVDFLTGPYNRLGRDAEGVLRVGGKDFAKIEGVVEAIAKYRV